MAEPYDNFSELTREQIMAIGERFGQEADSPKAVAFCLNCGSTLLDQNGINELRCINCGNTTIWNGYRFSIARPAHLQADFEDALRSRYHSDYFDAWHTEMDAAIVTFLQALIGESTRATRKQRVEDKADKLQTTWEDVKVRIDALMARRG